MTFDSHALKNAPTKYFQHFSELRNSEEEAITLRENLPIRKRGPEAGKYLLSCHPRLMANQYPPTFLVGPSTRVPLDLMPAKQSLFRWNPAQMTSFSISLITLP
ncbi:hypothetical protein CDAR_72011 [Caerostris darwini]|uniref:Uncharacterized protein n=1 Tax=Caerostris darwini TaxID=1538125 RepID=A0AAV4NQI3_9ARAC|nr:hypothetical protein CDAR_72011 [Caerostris darwini]